MKRPPAEERLVPQSRCLRAPFPREVPTLSAAQVDGPAVRAGASETTERGLREGRILPIKVEEEAVFPAWQSNARGQPRPAVGEVLTAPLDLRPAPRRLLAGPPGHTTHPAGGLRRVGSRNHRACGCLPVRVGTDLRRGVPVPPRGNARDPRWRGNAAGAHCWGPNAVPRQRRGRPSARSAWRHSVSGPTPDHPPACWAAPPHPDTRARRASRGTENGLGWRPRGAP